MLIKSVLQRNYDGKLNNCKLNKEYICNLWILVNCVSQRLSWVSANMENILNTTYKREKIKRSQLFCLFSSCIQTSEIFKCDHGRQNQSNFKNNLQIHIHMTLSTDSDAQRPTCKIWHIITRLLYVIDKNLKLCEM